MSDHDSNLAHARQHAFRVFGDLCNGELSEADGHWLREGLRGDENLRNMYVDYMALHSCLFVENASLGHIEEQALLPELTLGGELVPRDSSSATRWEEARNPALAWGWLAASLAAVALFSSALTYFATSRPAGLAGAAYREGGRPVARITGTQNCQWDNAVGEVGYGSLLVEGQTISLRQGLAEITFDDGATMLLESPAQVEFNGAHDVRVLEGRLAAVVPPEADSLRVHTDTMELVNVGNEFGLLAKGTGTSELHVFHGKVQAAVLDRRGSPRRHLEVKASQAVLASSLTTTLVEFPANETHFVRNMSVSPGPQDGLLAYEGFLYPPGPLSEQNGGFGWGGAWFDVEVDSPEGTDSNSVVAGSLAVQGFVPRGNHAALVAQRNRIRRSLATSVGGVFDVAGLVENQDGVRLIGRDGTTVYCSFLQRVSATDDGFYGVELHRGDGNPNRVLCIGNGADGTSYGATSVSNVYGVRNFPSLGDENAAVNFFVIKITFGGGNRDVVEVYRNPASLKDEDACEVTATLKGNFAFDRISLANFDGTKMHEVDELRLGTHFLAVTGRWGGERGRLLRPLALRETRWPAPSPQQHRLGNYRNSVLLAATKSWDFGVGVRE